MALNKLSDLHNHLFAQLERLSDVDASEETIKKEVVRAKAIHSISKNIIDNAKVSLEAVKFTYKGLPGTDNLPEQFKISK